MHRLSDMHLRLVPVIANRRAFSDPIQKTAIAENLADFAQTAAAIANDNKGPNADPLISFNAANLANDAKESYSAFQMGDLQRSRFAFGRTSTYCIGCHTRADRGTKDFEMSWTTELSSLNPEQKVEYLLANRRYHSALVRSTQLASDQKSAESDPQAWILTIKKVLGMVVRVNKDPAEAKELVQLVANNKGAPNYMRRDAASWLRDIRYWQNENRTASSRDSFKIAIRLIGEAQKSGPRSSSMLIPYLRASGILHELLEDTRSPRYGDVLLYAGMVADSLRELNYGYLDQFYYQSCIYHEPHSDLAERCYSRLEASVRDSDPFFDLDPESELETRSTLAELRKLADVKDMTDDPRWLRRPWENDLDEKSDRRSKDRH